MEYGVLRLQPDTVVFHLDLDLYASVEQNVDVAGAVAGRLNPKLETLVLGLFASRQGNK